MRTALLIILTSAVAACSSVGGVQSSAQSDEHAAHHPNLNLTEPPPRSMERADAQTATMQRMHELMAKIRASKDPAERRKLMAEHQRTMREQMQAMRDMGKMMGMHPEHEGRAAAGADANQCRMMQDHQAMQDRMDMMQDLIEQMQQSEGEYEEELEEEDEG